MILGPDLLIGIATTLRTISSGALFSIWVGSFFILLAPELLLSRLGLHNFREANLQYLGIASVFGFLLWVSTMFPMFIRFTSEVAKKRRVLKRLSHLVEDEIQHVRWALNKNQNGVVVGQSRDSGARSLEHKGLLAASPKNGKPENWDTYIFPDFVWSHLMKNKIVLLSRWEKKPA